MRTARETEVANLAARALLDAYLQHADRLEKLRVLVLMRNKYKGRPCSLAHLTQLRCNAPRRGLVQADKGLVKHDDFLFLGQELNGVREGRGVCLWRDDEAKKERSAHIQILPAPYLGQSRAAQHAA